MPDETVEYRFHHALRQTSTGKNPFRGTCIKCGKEDLPLAAVNERCPRGTVIQCKPAKLLRE